MDILQQFMKERKKPFKCEICNAEFTSKHGMKGHIATIHEGKKLFKCDICNASFGKKGNLNKHVATVHEGKKQFKCDICNAEFTSKGGMKGHIATCLLYTSPSPRDGLLSRMPSSA